LVAFFSMKSRHVCGMDLERMIVSERTKAVHNCILSNSILGISVKSYSSCSRRRVIGQTLRSEVRLMLHRRRHHTNAHTKTAETYRLFKSTSLGVIYFIIAVYVIFPLE
jgi:hypothetical protein